MNEGFQAIVHGAVLALIFGWVHHVGKDVFISIVLGILVVYTIVGPARLLSRVPHLGRLLPVPITAVMAIVLSEYGGTRSIPIFVSRDGRL